MRWLKLYLGCYNTVQLVLWAQVALRILSNTAVSLLRDDEKVTALTSFSACIPYAARAQTLAWVEVVHAALGLAGGGVAAVFIQCLARYVVLVDVVVPIEVMHSAWTTVIMIFVWSLGDVVRYAFYLRAMASKRPGVLLWLRYSLFLVLYPVGIVSEWLVYLFTLSYVDETDMYAVKMPNAWNFSFNFGVWNRIVLTVYFYFGPFMFLHMLKQRRKKLGIA